MKLTHEAEWKSFNKAQKDRRLKMSYDEYVKWVYGIKTKSKTKTGNFEFKRADINKRQADSIPSLITSYGSCTKNSMVSKVQMGLITGDDADQIIAKSKSIAIPYSKGSYQYVTDQKDVKTLGQKR